MARILVATSAVILVGVMGYRLMVPTEDISPLVAGISGDIAAAERTFVERVAAATYPARTPQDHATYLIENGFSEQDQNGAPRATLTRDQRGDCMRVFTVTWEVVQRQGSHMMPRAPSRRVENVGGTIVGVCETN